MTLVSGGSSDITGTCQESGNDMVICAWYDYSGLARVRYSY